MRLQERIEYTKLNPKLKGKELKRIAKLAANRGYRSVVTYYNNIGAIKEACRIHGYPLKAVTVYGFNGYNKSITENYKLFFDELDMVMPLRLYYYNYPPFLKEIEDFIKKTKAALSYEEPSGEENKIKIRLKPLKLIIETALMRDKNMQIKELCKLAKRAQVDCIKTNTGFTKKEELDEHIESIKLIRKYWKGQIKASGGIKTEKQAKKLVKAGADLIGTSTDIMAPVEEVYKG